MAHKQTRWLMRQAVRVSKKTLKTSARATSPARKVRATVASPNGQWSADMALAPAIARRYRFFKPPGLSKAQGYPLLVMLHGCAQNAKDFAASTRMNRLAASSGFMVLYPEQERLSNAQGCWNWFDARNGRAKSEAASIVAALDHACALHPIDRARIAIVGMSAGASMAALVALLFPQRFAAVVMHSGVEPTMAHSSATALVAMRGRYRVAIPPYHEVPLALPALLVLQGSADPVVLKVNGMRAAQAWAARTHAQPQASRVVHRGNRYPFTTMDWNIGKHVQVTLSEISGLAHAWSGGAASQAFSDPKGPDASRMAWAFAKRQFARRPSGVKTVFSEKS